MAARRQADEGFDSRSSTVVPNDAFLERHGRWQGNTPSGHGVGIVRRTRCGHGLDPSADAGSDRQFSGGYKVVTNADELPRCLLAAIPRVYSVCSALERHQSATPVARPSNCACRQGGLGRWHKMARDGTISGRPLKSAGRPRASMPGHCCAASPRAASGSRSAAAPPQTNP